MLQKFNVTKKAVLLNKKPPDFWQAFDLFLTLDASAVFRSSCSQMFYKISALKNFTKFCKCWSFVLGSEGVCQCVCVWGGGGRRREGLVFWHCLRPHLQTTNLFFPSYYKFSNSCLTSMTLFFTRTSFVVLLYCFCNSILETLKERYISLSRKLAWWKPFCFPISFITLTKIVCVH